MIDLYRVPGEPTACEADPNRRDYLEQRARRGSQGHRLERLRQRLRPRRRGKHYPPERLTDGAVNSTRNAVSTRRGCRRCIAMPSQ